jgi:hypothetical protein
LNWSLVFSVNSANFLDLRLELLLILRLDSSNNIRYFLRPLDNGLVNRGGEIDVGILSEMVHLGHFEYLLALLLQLWVSMVFLSILRLGL